MLALCHVRFSRAWARSNALKRLAVVFVLAAYGGYTYAAYDRCRVRMRDDRDLCLGALANPFNPGPPPPPPVPVIAEWFVIPDGGEGVPSAIEMCDAIPADNKVGNWYCIYSDGGIAPGSSLTWASASNFGNYLDLISCPSGSSCGPLRHTEMVDGGGMYSSAYNPTTTPFTTCGIWNLDLSNQQYKNKLEGNVAGYFVQAGWALYTDQNNGSYAFAAWDDALNFSIARNVGTLRGADQAICGVYPADGGPVRSYRDLEFGAESVTSISGIGTLGQPLPHAWTGTNFESAAVTEPVRSRGMFYTERVLDAGEIAYINNLSRAITLETFFGEELTHTRASSISCSYDTSPQATQANVVAGGSPCIAQGKLYIGRAGVNLMPRSNAMQETAIWVPIGTPASTRATTRDHFQTFQSVTFNDDSAVLSEGVAQSVFTTGQTGVYTFSCWMMSQDGGTGRLSMTGGANSVGDSDCSWPLTNVSTRYACTSDAGYTADPLTISAAIRVGPAAANVGSVQAIDCQLEQYYRAGPYVQSYTSAVNRDPDLAQNTHFFDGGIRSASGQIRVPERLSGTHNIIQASYAAGAANFAAWFSDDGGTLTCSWVNTGGNVLQRSSVPFTLGSDEQWTCIWTDAGVPTACIGSSCATGAPVTGFVTNGGAATVTLGGNIDQVSELDSFMWNTCLDKSPIGCDYR